jgi:hypothetical protein
MRQEDHEIEASLGYLSREEMGTVRQFLRKNKRFLGERSPKSGSRCCKELPNKDHITCRKRKIY